MKRSLPLDTHTQYSPWGQKSSFFSFFHTFIFTHTRRRMPSLYKRKSIIRAFYEYIVFFLFEHAIHTTSQCPLCIARARATKFGLFRLNGINRQNLISFSIWLCVALSRSLSLPSYTWCDVCVSYARKWEKGNFKLSFMSSSVHPLLVESLFGWTWNK